MEDYKKPIYDFLTQKENFDKMASLLNSYDEIKKQLLTEFWNLVKQKLDSDNAVSGSKWIVHLVEDIFTKYSRIYLSKEKWMIHKGNPLMCVSWENLTKSPPRCGIWLNYDANVLDIEQVKKHAQNHPISNTFMKDSNGWWAFWQNGNIHFHQPQDIGKILPDEREGYVNEHAETIFNLATTMETELDKMFEMTK